MNKPYPYRFKTREEFEKQYGRFWSSIIQHRWNDQNRMDYLFGQDYPYYIDKNTTHLPAVNGTTWLISWDMLTENYKIPDYTPKGKMERTLE